MKTETREETVRVTSPVPKPIRRANTRTRQLASSIPKPKWRPPQAGSQRKLPVVKYKSISQETLEPAGETPVDPDDPGGSSTTSSDEFDPGPRVMKYIGFRQMADVSRVFIRLDGKAKYKSYKSSAGLVVELVNTSVPGQEQHAPPRHQLLQQPRDERSGRPLR